MKEIQRANEFRMARELSRAISGMNSLELRVVFALLAIREKGELEIEIMYQELMQLLGIKRGTNADKRMKVAMRALRKKTDITIPKEFSRTGNEIDCFIIPEVEWDDDNKSKAFIRFSNKVTPMLDDLKGDYDFYLLSQMARFTKSDYSALIYQFCTMILPIGKKSIEYIWWLDKTDTNPNSFREWTGTLKKYPEWYELKRWAIEPAIKEINEKSDITISYTTKKRGKNIVGLNMTISRKKKSSVPTDLLQIPQPEPEIEGQMSIDDFADQEQEIIFKGPDAMFLELNHVEKLGLTEAQVHYLKTECRKQVPDYFDDPDVAAYRYLMDKVRLMRTHKNIKNVFGWLKSAVTEDYE